MIKDKMAPVACKLIKNDSTSSNIRAKLPEEGPFAASEDIALCILSEAVVPPDDGGFASAGIKSSKILRNELLSLLFDFRGGGPADLRRYADDDDDVMRLLSAGGMSASFCSISAPFVWMNNGIQVFHV